MRAVEKTGQVVGRRLKLRFFCLLHEVCHIAVNKHSTAIGQRFARHSNDLPFRQPNIA
jgi:hypothetical protein